MNKKGFTLIELLGSIIILATLALVAFPAILRVLDNGQEQVDTSVIKFIKSAAEECVNENNNNYNTMCNTVQNLKDNGYITTTFYEKYQKGINENIIIKKNNSNNKYCYGYGNNDSEFNKCMNS